MLLGHLSGLKPSHHKWLERLSCRRIPSELLVTWEIAKSCAEFAQETGRDVGLLINRRGAINHILVGRLDEVNWLEVVPARSGLRSLRGVRMIRSHLHKGPLTQEELTELALRRFDLMSAFDVEADGTPGLFHLAHLVPQNTRGTLYEVWPPTRFQEMTLTCHEFLTELDGEFSKDRKLHHLADNDEAAILVSAAGHARGAQEDRLAELQELVCADGVQVLGTVSQRVSDIHPRFVIGSGKLKQVIGQAVQKGANVLVFENDLTPAQVRAIGEVTDLKVIDRTQVILDIFARRAHSREGKLRVELAQLNYLLPRLSGYNQGLSRLGGGIGARGPGETKLETDRRRVRDRITHLERQLVDHDRQRDQRRGQRLRRSLPIVSIVGYTNAGKSTLLNTLTKSEVAAAPRPFETLDTTARRLRIPRDRDVIITDTVGFIRDLPPDLLGAFRSTLSELQDADLLLHVVDAGSDELEIHVQTVERILTELQVGDVPRVLVLNKCDRLSPEERVSLLRRHEGVGIVAHDAGTLPPLLAAIAHVLPKHDPMAAAWHEQDGQIVHAS